MPPPDAGPDASPPALLDISPGAHDFGPVVLSGEASFTFAVDNDGGSRSGILSVTLGDPATYSLSGDTCTGERLDPDESCQVTVTFGPSGAPGARPSTVTIAASPGGEATATLAGTAVTAAELTLSPASEPFGVVDAGGQSTEHTFMLKNEGDVESGPLALSTTNERFTISSESCPAALAPDATCTIGVRFAPAGAGAQVGSLVVSAAPGGTATAALSGTGRATVMLTFAGSGGGTVTSDPPGLSCTGSCSVAFTSTSVTLSAEANGLSSFGSWSGDCSGTGACALDLDEGNRAATVTFAALPPSLTIEPTGHDFGTVLSDSESMPHEFIVTNDGGTATQSLSASLSDTTNYSISFATCPGISLAAGGGTCAVWVMFNPHGDFYPSTGVTTAPMPATLTVSGGAGVSVEADLDGTVECVTYLGDCSVDDDCCGNIPCTTGRCIFN
jgi:hypothetical protein